MCKRKNRHYVCQGLHSGKWVMGDLPGRCHPGCGGQRNDPTAANRVEKESRAAGGSSHWVAAAWGTENLTDITTGLIFTFGTSLNNKKFCFSFRWLLCYYRVQTTKKLCVFTLLIPLSLIFQGQFFVVTKFHQRKLRCKLSAKTSMQINIKVACFQIVFQAHCSLYSSTSGLFYIESQGTTKVKIYIPGNINIWKIL